MKRLKKELSWLLVVALVVSSLVVGLGQVRTSAANMVGTSRIRAIIHVKKDDMSCDGGGNDHRGTDSSFDVRFLNAGGGTVASFNIPDGPENDKTETYTSGQVTVNQTITKCQLIETVHRDEFCMDWIEYYYENGPDQWVKVAEDRPGGGTDQFKGVGDQRTVATTWFTSNVKTLTFNANGGSPNSTYDAIPYQTISAPGAPSRTGHTFAGWSGVPARMPNGNSTYYAAWTANTYTVSFNSNNGSTASPTSKTVTYASNYGTLATTSRTGYTFNGWYMAASGGTEVKSTTTVATASNHTLYAQWSINSYTITFDGNGGSTPSAITQNYGTTVTAPANPTRAGYTFNGWSPACPTTMPANNTTCVAQWTLNTYTITWNANGGTGGGTTSVNHGATPTPPTVSKTGYTFAGWSPTIVAATGAATYTAQWNINSYTITWNANGGTGGTTTSVNHGATPTPPTVSRTGYTFAGWSPAIVAATGATTYTAQWNINSYTITFDGNGGSTPSAITQNYGTTVTAPANPTRAGHTFTGWSPVCPTTMPAGNTTCVAQWTANQYTISFNSNGGSAVSSVTQDYGTQASAPTAPTKAGNTFAGWYTDAGLTNAVSWPHTITGDVNFYAKWTVNNYNITFNANGGTGGWGPGPMAYGAALVAPTVTRTGYSFKQWAPGVPSTVPAEDATYNAVWTINKYTVSFNSNGGSTVAPINQDYNSSVAQPTAPTKAGNTFDGWYPDAALTTAVTWPYTLGAADVTFYAKWTVNSYDIKFDANGGTGGWGPTAMAYGAVLSAPTVTRTGYAFNGWSPQVPGTVPATDTTYVAQWGVNSYTISFDSDGGSAVTSISQDYATAVTAPSDPTKAGYTFLGWVPTVPPTMPAGNLECVAQWSINSYTITWDADGGTGGGTNSCDHGETPIPVGAGTKVGYTFTGWAPSIVAATEAAIYTAQWSASAVNITFDANGGTGGIGATSMQPGTTLTAPAVTKDGYVFGGWLPTVPATVPETDMTYVAQWVQTAVNVTKTQDGMVVNIQGWTADSKYQIWTYQQVKSDDLLSGDTNVQANQWILAMSYASGGSVVPEGDGSISFTVSKDFTSPTENYLIAVRIADVNNNFVAEIRDAYTPEDLGIAVITKILVDNVVTTGYELREIVGGAEMLIKVIGNDVPNITYTATILSGSTPMPLTMVGNELPWNISTLDPGIYTVEFTATNGNTTATQIMTFELFATAAPDTGYGILNNMTLTPVAGGVNITSDHANGQFSFRIREPGRAIQVRSDDIPNSGTTFYAKTEPGIYHVNGYVIRAGLIGTETGGFDDGMIRTLVIPRTGEGSGPVTMTLTANQTLPDVVEGTPIVFTAAATGLPGVEYSFWRYDATGYVLVKDWSSSDTLNWTPARIGEYNIEARAKGTGAGSYEIKKSLTVNITGTESKANITAITLNTTELGAAQAKQPIMLKADATSLNGEDLLYKFYVYDADMLNSQLKGYTVDQYCVWTPRKAGMTYTISVLVKNQASFGKYDAIESFEVTVN